MVDVWMPPGCPSSNCHGSVEKGSQTNDYCFFTKTAQGSLHIIFLGALRQETLEAPAAKKKHGGV